MNYIILRLIVIKFPNKFQLAEFYDLEKQM